MLLNKTGSSFVTIPGSKEYKAKKLEPCNHIDVLSIPSGITAYVSFTENPSSTQKYPLKNNSRIQLKKAGANYHIGADVYLWTSGKSTEDIELNLSTLGNDETNVVISQSADKVNLSTDVANAIKMSNFICNGRASEHTISVNDYTEINIENLQALKYHTTGVLGMEQNKNGIKFPINGTDDIFTNDMVHNIRFHNNTTEDITLTLLYMGDINILNLNI